MILDIRIVFMKIKGIYGFFGYVGEFHIKLDRYVLIKICNRFVDDMLIEGYLHFHEKNVTDCYFEG